MASTKSLEDMLLSSDIDESAVSALVGSLESQLSSSDGHYPRAEISALSVNNNHITSASECSAGPKHGALLGTLLEQGTANKNLANSQILGLNNQNLSNAVIVSLPGALPASGYINQVSSAQQALLNSAVVGRHVSSADIKLVYSPHSTSSAFCSPVSSVVTSGVITSNQISRNNLKVTALHNGSSNFSTGQIVTATSVAPVLSGTQTSGVTMSAIHNLANIASQQPRIQVLGPGGQPQTLTQQQINALNAKNVTRNQVDQNKVKQNTGDHRHTPSPVLHNHYQVLSAQQSVISTSKPNSVSHMSGQPVNVVTQVVTNPNMLPHGVQILNVNPARFGQKTLAPRGVVVGNQVRIAPQMLRQGTPIQVPGQNAIALPASMRGALVVRADGSQYHVFNVAPPGLQSGSAASPNATYRLQSLAGGVPSIIRTISPQQVMSVPVSSGAVKTLQVSNTVINTAVRQPITTTSASRNSSVTTPSSTAAMSPNTIKKKCQNFLSTLIKLAGDQTTKTASNVKKLIQNLIDETIEPEEFSTQLQKELRSSPQPYLIHFLKKSLPHVRQSLMTKEMTIEGIRPPPLPPSMQTMVPTSQVGRTTLSTPIRGSALTAQLAQPPGSTLLTQRLVSPRPAYGSLSASSPATVGALKGVVPKLLKTTIREKKTFVSVRDEDDINDVAAMGGVNLVEESQRILASNSELIGAQIRSCKDDTHLVPHETHRHILAVAKKCGFEEVRGEVVELISHAAELRLKTLVEKVGLVAEHRLEKADGRYEVATEPKAQIKFLEELDRLEKKRHDDQEREILLKAAKSRSKLEDPEQLKLKQKAKEMQRAEIEEMRQREANMTALLAIGPRKKPRTEPPSPTQAGGSGLSSSSNSSSKTPVRPRVKRVNLRDLLFVMENEHRTVRRPLLYKYYAK